MRRRLLILLVLLLLNPLLLSSAARAGGIEHIDLPSPSLGRALPAYVYLPKGYAESNLSYPVLYLLHGFGGKDGDWLAQGNLEATMDRLIEAGTIPPALVVMPSAERSWYVDTAGSEKMETAFIRDLLPGIEKRYRVLARRDGRLLGGLSMGGYGAMRFGLKYPELFAAAALFSPAIYNPEPPENSSARKVGVFGQPFDVARWQALNYPALLPGFLAKGLPLPTFIASGDDDEFQIELHATLYYSTLRRARQPAELRIVNGAHSWAVWEGSLAEALGYIFQTAAKPQVTE
ncbi:MAG: esterase family protein [Ferrovibrio sp.]|nr:esterase family protein [Ferrovibrio sp.]